MHCPGVVCEASFSGFGYDTISDPFRCDASNKNLDGEGGRRSHALTDALFDALDHKTLWDDYGIIPDVIVSLLSFYSFLFARCGINIY